jgi:hypothetical protein
MVTVAEDVNDLIASALHTDIALRAAFCRKSLLISLQFQQRGTSHQASTRRQSAARPALPRPALGRSCRLLATFCRRRLVQRLMKL